MVLGLIVQARLWQMSSWAWYLSLLSSFSSSSILEEGEIVGMVDLSPNIDARFNVDGKCSVVNSATSGTFVLNILISFGLVAMWANLLSVIANLYCTLSNSTYAGDAEENGKEVD